jgi:glycine/D-amino acid oxidase-like deaminating enzyme
VGAESDYRGLSFWHENLPGLLEARPALLAETRCDVAIVGAGYTGLWTAWYLKQLEPSLAVTIIEAETAGYGASGRNGGWCSAWLSGIEHWLDDPARREGAIRLQKLMFQTVREIGEVTAGEALDCHYERSGALQIAVNSAQLERLEQELHYVRGLGFDDADYRWLDRRHSGLDVAAPGCHPPAALRRYPPCAAGTRLPNARRQGAVIHEQSPVLECGPGEARTPGRSPTASSSPPGGGRPWRGRSAADRCTR